MTTRAGLVGLVTGIIGSAVLVYPFYWVWPGFYIENWPVVPRLPAVFLILPAIILTGLGGGLASAWSGTGRLRQIGAGALAGGLAALVLYSSVGAATAGLVGLGEAGATTGPLAPETAARIIALTHTVFWGLTLGGILLGAAGALFPLVFKFAPPAKYFGGPEPQMALNTTLTALPATAFALILVAVFSSRLPDSKGLWHWPLVTGLLLYLSAQLALSWVTAYEARQATHRCGIDEVKMAAYVGIGVPMVTALILGPSSRFLPDGAIITGAVLVSLGMSARMIFVLFRLILPRRAGMLPPADEWEATLFGSIAGSRWQSLVWLCLGCAIMMIAPVQVVVGAATINLALAGSLKEAVLAGYAPVAPVQRWYVTQALAGWGSVGVVWLMLTVVYLVYLGLGKAFHRVR